MASAADIFAEVIKWIRESVRPVVVILVLSALALFLPQMWLCSIGIGDWLQKWRPWVILLFTGSLVWLGTFPFEWLYRACVKRSRLRHLAGDEKHILRPYIQNAKTTQAFGPLHIGVVKSLVRQGLLVQVHTPQRVGEFPHFTIDLSAFAYLRKHPELVDIPS